MLNLKVALEDKLKQAKRIAILGIGSELRGDDAAGMLVAKSIRESCRDMDERFKVFLGATAPENLTAEIKRFNPTHLVIVDSADMGMAASTIMLINPAEAGGFSFSTHRLPLKMMLEYLLLSINCEIIIIGIQPKKIDFGACLSKEVEGSVGRIAQTFKEILTAP